MTKSLDGKVALITGAASGIGEAAAILFAKHGARTVVADLDGEKGEAVVEVIRQAGGDAFFHKVDITESEQVRALIAATVGRYGRLDCAYNNAGYGGPDASTSVCASIVIVPVLKIVRPMLIAVASDGTAGVVYAAWRYVDDVGNSGLCANHTQPPLAVR